jgi:hypothetical protein
VVTIMDIPVPIHLPVGLSKPTLARWRDSLSYVVIGMSLPAALIGCTYTDLVDAVSRRETLARQAERARHHERLYHLRPQSR